MSLVHQALRKAEQEKHRKTGAMPRAAAPVTPSLAVNVPVAVRAVTPAAEVAPQPAPAERGRLVWPWMVLGCVLGFAVVAVVVMLTREQPSAAAAASSSAVSATTTVPAAATEPPPSLPPAAAAGAGTVDESRYQLTGIAQEPDGRPVAVINGQPRYENQYIDGATIQKIERDRVTLDVNGQSIVKRLY